MLYYTGMELSVHHAIVDCTRAQLVLIRYDNCRCSLWPADVVISAFSVVLVSVSRDSVLNVTDLRLSEGHHILLLLFAIVALADGSDALYAYNLFPCPSALPHGESTRCLDTYDAIFPFEAPWIRHHHL